MCRKFPKIVDDAVITVNMLLLAFSGGPQSPSNARFRFFESFRPLFSDVLGILGPLAALQTLCTQAFQRFGVSQGLRKQDQILHLAAAL